MKIEEESVVTSRGRCPSCATKGHDRAGDNLANYDDGHSYCFSCGYYILIHLIFSVCYAAFSNFISQCFLGKLPVLLVCLS